MSIKSNNLGIEKASRRRCSRLSSSMAIAALAVGVSFTSSAMAAGFDTDVGSSERINLAGQLGTLSERITAAGCNLSAGIATVESEAVLQISTHHFTRIRDALLFGNRGFGILGEETRPRTLKAINDLNALWEPLQTEANSTQRSSGDIAHVASLADQSGPLQREAMILVSEITGQYADPVALLHADAMLIDIAGRQRMLAERMSKNICLISSDINEETALEELKSTINLFDTSLSALRNGLESVGVRPPPTKKIADGLEFVVVEWDKIRPTVDGVAAGEAIDDETRAMLFNAFLGMEARMNNVVHMYDDNSKLNL